jgi:carboxypeptidase family protein
VAPDDLWAAGSYEEGALIEHAPSSTQGAIVGQTNVSFSTVSWFGPENGSVETNDLGGYQIGGLDQGTYTMIATEAGCQPDSRTVTVVAGATLDEDFHIGCSRNLRSDGALGPG